MRDWLVRTNKVRVALAALTAATLLSSAHAAHAQQGGFDRAGGPPPQNGGFGGQDAAGGQGGGFGGQQGQGQGQGRRGQGGMMGQPRDVKAFQVPAATLASLLKLNASQKIQVATAITRYQGRLTALREAAVTAQTASAGDDNGNGGGNGAQGRQRFGQGGGVRIDFARLQTITTSAEQDIEAALDSGQKDRLPTVLAAIRVLRDGGVPIPLAGQLNLSEDQIDKLAALAPKDDPQGGGNRRPQQAQASQNTPRVLPSNVATLLTTAQKDWIEPWLSEIQTGGAGMPGMGGPGGMGGGGGRGGFAFGGGGQGGPGGGGPGGGRGGPDGNGPPPPQD